MSQVALLESLHLIHEQVLLHFQRTSESLGQLWTSSLFPSLQRYSEALVHSLSQVFNAIASAISLLFVSIPWDVILQLCREQWLPISCTLLALLLASYYAMKPTEEQRFRRELQACWKDVYVLCQNTNLHPIFVRLAWSDVADYDCTLRDWPYCGGANGSIRFDSDLQDNSNGGLAMGVAMLAPCKQKYPLISWADLIQMSAVASIYTAQGPFIDLAYGREDVPIDIRDMTESQARQYRRIWQPRSATNVSSEDILKRSFPKVFPPYPLGEQSAAIHLRIFFNRLGLKAQEGVVLCGGHTMGRAFKDRTGVCPFSSGDQGATVFTKSTAPVESMAIKTGIAGGGSWTKNWLQFDNSYFRRPLEDAQNTQLIWLPTDQALVEDAEFQQYFSLYANDQARFFADFAQAFKKISEFGAKFKYKLNILHPKK